MSHPFGGFSGSSIVIHQDRTENAANALRKSKRDEFQGKPPESKRAALGVITNNTRVQPSRAAKQALGSEGLSSVQQTENVQVKAGKVFAAHSQLCGQIGGTGFSIPSSSQPFSIHIDDPAAPTINALQTNIENREPRLELNPSVTSLRRPLGPVNESYDVSPVCLGHGSPMVLDSSIEVNQEETAESRFRRVLTVPEYSDDIYTYLRESELRSRPKAGYIRKQPDITNSMRSILVDWLVEVCEEYKLHRETLCLSVNYIDRFLSQMSVLRGKLQLVGAASIFLAAKYEEIYPPEVGEFVYITDDTYTQKQVLRMEHLILKVLSFDVAVPTVNCLCEKFLEHQEADEKTASLAMYLAELSLVDGEPFLKYIPSVTAAASVCLANQTRGLEPWSAHMVQKTGYTIAELQECLHDLYQAMCKAPQHPQQAVRDKYKQPKYHQVALLSPPPMLLTVNQ